MLYRSEMMYVAVGYLNRCRKEATEPNFEGFLDYLDGRGFLNTENLKNEFEKEIMRHDV